MPCMESDVTQSPIFYKAWAWGETHKKQLLWGVVAVLVVALGIAFWVAHQNATQDEANDALSKLTTRVMSAGAPPPQPDAFLKVGSDYAGTDAGARALLLGAAELFTAGKYDDARAQFQKFSQEHSDSPFAAQAALGVAACLDAQGKTNEAVEAYQSVVGRYSADPNVTVQAKFALGRLLEGQGKLGEARSTYEDIARSFPYGSIGSESMRRFEALTAAHPELVPTNRPTASPSTMPLLNPKN